MEGNHYQSFLHTAFGQVFQLVRNLELQRATPTISHQRNLVSKVEHHSGQVSDFSVIHFAEWEGLPPVLGIVHPSGDLRA